jgi:CcmD family protein
MDNLWYLAAAYAVVWLGAFAYLASLARTGRNIREEMALLRDLIDGSDVESETAPPEADAYEERAKLPATPQRQAVEGWPALER